MDIENESIPSIDKLFEEFDHPNPYINKRACISMSKYYRDDSIQRLIKKLQDNDIEIRRKSVICLACFGRQVILPVCTLFHSNEDRVIRVCCLKVLVKLTSEIQVDQFKDEIFEIINVALEDENPEVILTVISLLRQLENLGTPYLKKLCKDKNILKAKAAVTAISELKNASIPKFLEELASDNSIDSFIRDSVNDLGKYNKEKI